ncbi:MAG: ATP synthase F1 subunit gamma [Dehalococcoidia bacterium]|nr:ATP synthase F1 subunit gamma [Dehalococcoidia bacterium]
MGNVRLIRRRIKGVQSISKITKAMEMIAASKMRRTQERGLQGRPYTQKITEVMASLAAVSQGKSTHPLLEVRQPPKRIELVHIAPDRGLSGGLVSNLNRRAANFILEEGLPTSVVAVGRKGVEFMRRTSQDVVAEFVQLGDKPSLLDTLPITRIVMDDFIKGKTDAVYVCYARFVNTMVQTPTVTRILPVVTPTLGAGATKNLTEYIFEPNADTVLNALLPRFVEMGVYHAVLESIASEQSARMIAMRNATKSAHELIDDLTLVYNKARQESITTELLDIIGGAAALT